jgi:hypothetical protein
MNTPIQYTLCAVLIAAVAACGSKNDPSKENFSIALTQYLKQEGQLCVDVGSWPVVTLMGPHISPNSEIGRLKALEAAGLLKGTADAKGWSKSFAPTEAAKPFQMERSIRVAGMGGFKRVNVNSLCWAQKELQSVDQWDQPMKLGDYQATMVHFTYKLVNVADWAKRPEVLEAFPVIRKEIEAEPQKSRNGVKLTSEGWQATGMD